MAESDPIILRPQQGAQEKFLSSPADICIFGGAAYSGKRGDITIPVPTETGWTTLGDIKVGDRIFAVDGSVSTVTKVYPIELATDAYEVEFLSGEVFKVDGEHLWKTTTYAERNGNTRRTDEFREKRRSVRPSRALPGNNKPLHREVLIRRNQDRVYDYKPISYGTVKSTHEIMESLREPCRNRFNHTIPICGAIDLPHNDLLFNPYVLGLFLGDGYATSGMIGCLEEDMNEMMEHFDLPLISSKVFTENYSKPYKSIRIEGFYNFIRTNNLQKNKHIPIEYLRASVQQRLELLQGLMDTDGTCDAGGSCSIGLSDKRLADDVHHLICSLGIKANIKLKKIAVGEDSNVIHFTTDIPVFKLKRKLARQDIENHKFNRATKSRTIIDVRKTDPCLMRCIEIDHPSHLFLIGNTFVPTHNSYCLLLEHARHVHIPGFQSVIFRREAKQITNPGGLRDTSMSVYPYLGGILRAQPTTHWIFPSGSTIDFLHINQESDVLSYQGSQIALLSYDELTHFSYYQFFYMLSRNRSMTGVKPYVRATTNPDPDSWVADFISWWIDQDTGYPIYERSGVLRYMIRMNDQIIWADDKQELMEEYDVDEIDINSVTFIPGKITDNALGMKADPSYLGKLKAMSFVERSRLLDGNWKIRPLGGMYFPRYDATLIDWLPTDCIRWIRSWDLAASEAIEGKRVDWTVGALVGRRANGKIVIGDIIRVQRKADAVRDLVRRTADRDGKEVWIAIPQDPGQAGKQQIQSYKELLKDRVVLSRYITKNKLTMAEPFAALWQHGNVEIVRGKWNEDFLTELEAFPDGKHDDQVDPCSAAVQRLPGHVAPDYSKGGVNSRFKSLMGKRVC